MFLRSYLSQLKRVLSKHPTLVEVGISRANLMHNLHTYQKTYPGLSFAPVLKSNAYGHGLVLVARLLDKEQVAFFALDSVYEARVLRRHDICSRLVVMGYVLPEEIRESTLWNTDFALVDLEQIRELSQTLRKHARFHLKLDTGMHRLGIMESDLEEALALIQTNPHLEVVGICSHFADADNTERSFTNRQIDSWKKMERRISETFPSITYRHIAATKGSPVAKEVDTNVARLGIGLYGFDTSPLGSTNLKPVMELRSIISSLRTVPAGESVGYNTTFTATRPTIIATVPTGYYEGVDRRLSNRGTVLVKGHPAPIAGRVSMNMVCVDVTDVPGAKRGDRVVLISNTPDAPNTADRIAAGHTIPYEVLIHVPPHLLRVVE